jgi:hypothetical protein
MCLATHWGWVASIVIGVFRDALARPFPMLGATSAFFDERTCEETAGTLFFFLQRSGAKEFVLGVWSLKPWPATAAISLS